jgi:hypothetical protein
VSIKDKYYVERITFQDCKEWLLYKHYAHRIPSISYAFGLFDNDKILQGVCTFGMIANFFECESWSPFKVLELNRFVLNENLEKNIASYFISKCFKLMISPVVIISYSDIDQNHNGYIYQALNFIYTGIGGIIRSEKYLLKNGELKHRRHKDKIKKDDIEKIIIPKGKHRYYYFIGTKKEKKEMLKALRYEIQPYPKGENKNYDASYEPTIQVKLF